MFGTSYDSGSFVQSLISQLLGGQQTNAGALRGMTGGDFLQEIQQRIAAKNAARGRSNPGLAGGTSQQPVASRPPSAGAAAELPPGQPNVLFEPGGAGSGRSLNSGSAGTRVAPAGAVATSPNMGALGGGTRSLASLLQSSMMSQGAPAQSSQGGAGPQWQMGMPRDLSKWEMGTQMDPAILAMLLGGRNKLF